MKKILIEFIAIYGSQNALCMAIGIDSKKLSKIMAEEEPPCFKTLLFLTINGIEITDIVKKYDRYQPKYHLKKVYSPCGVWRYELGGTHPLGITYQQFLKLKPPIFSIIQEWEKDGMIFTKEIYTGLGRAIGVQLHQLKCSDPELKYVKTEINSSLEVLVLQKEGVKYIVEQVIVP